MILRNILGFFLALPCAILLLPFVVAGLFLRLVAICLHGISRILQSAYVPWPDLMQYDPLLGWRARPNLNAYYLADRDDVFRLETDADGWPGRDSIEDRDIVVIGDSFAFGYGVNPENSFAQVDPELRLKALGAPGYSLVHGVLLLEELGTRLMNKTVVWFVYPENDLPDCLMPNVRKYRAPFLRWDSPSEQWEIAREHVGPAPWECSLLAGRLPVFGRAHVPGPESDRVFSACDYLIERASVACREAGARLAIVSIPHPMELDPELERLRSLGGNDPEFKAGLPHSRIGSHCQRLGLPFLSGLNFLSLDDYKKREGVHWNNRGHRRVAVELKRFCASIRTKDGCLDQSNKKVSNVS